MKLRAFSFLVLLGIGGCSTTSDMDYFRPTQEDIDILVAARGYLDDPAKWDKNEETQCNLEAEAFSLFCALQKASYDVLDEFQLRRPALEEVRYVIEEKSPEVLDRRLIDYNNMESTTLEDIQGVLDLALERIRALIEQSGG